VQPVPGVLFASQAATNLSCMLRIGANLSLVLIRALVVESSKHKQYTRNKKKTLLTHCCYLNFLASTIFRPNTFSTLFRAPCSAQEQQDAYECAHFFHACIVQKSSFACVTVFHILNLLFSPRHNLCYHCVIEK
jgi:hypothetical protein